MLDDDYIEDESQDDDSWDHNDAPEKATEDDEVFGLREGNADSAMKSVLVSISFNEYRKGDKLLVPWNDQSQRWVEQGMWELEE